MHLDYYGLYLISLPKAFNKKVSMTVEIKNMDAMCFARVFAVCLEHFNRSQAASKDERKTATKALQHLKSKNRKQAEDECPGTRRRANVPYNRPIALTDIHLFEEECQTTVTIFAAF